jgi:hypothetical protein
MTTDMTDFYEDDEPVEKVKKAFEGGTKGVTGPPPPRAPGQIGINVPKVVATRTKGEPVLVIKLGPRRRKSEFQPISALSEVAEKTAK